MKAQRRRRGTASIAGKGNGCILSIVDTVSQCIETKQLHSRTCNSGLQSCHKGCKCEPQKAHSCSAVLTKSPGSALCGTNRPRGVGTSIRLFIVGCSTLWWVAGGVRAAAIGFVSLSGMQEPSEFQSYRIFATVAE